MGLPGKKTDRMKSEIVRKKFIDSSISNINLMLQNTDITDKLGIFQLSKLDDEAFMEMMKC